MKVKKLLNPRIVKYSVADESLSKTAKDIESNNQKSAHQVAKNMIKPLKSKIKNSAKSELKVHESITIPLNDPFHDV